MVITKKKPNSCFCEQRMNFMPPLWTKCVHPAMQIPIIHLFQIAKQHCKQIKYMLTTWSLLILLGTGKQYSHTHSLSLSLYLMFISVETTGIDGFVYILIICLKHNTPHVFRIIIFMRPPIVHNIK